MYLLCLHIPLVIYCKITRRQNSKYANIKFSYVPKTLWLEMVFGRSRGKSRRTIGVASNKANYTLKYDVDLSTFCTLLVLTHQVLLPTYMFGKKSADSPFLRGLC